MLAPRLAAICSLLVLAALAASCSSARVPPGVPTGDPTPAPLAAQVVQAASLSAAAPARRPPPSLLAAAMPGDPAAAALAEARLVTSSCDDFQDVARRQAEARLKKMRAELDEAFQSWREAQPGCWEELRMQAEAARLSAQGAHGGLASHGFGSGHDVRVGSLGSALSGLPSNLVVGALDTGGGSVPREAKRKSGTNNQVAGVDEADLVKTDGRFVYLAMNGALRIVEALRPRLVSATPLGGNVRELFVEGDRAVVYVSSGKPGKAKRCTYGYDCAFAGDGTATRILVLDVADRAAPRVVRTLDLSGSLMAARRIGDAVHTVVADGDAPQAVYATWPDGLATCGSLEAAVKARFARLRVENERKIVASTWFPSLREKGVERPLCAGLLRSAVGDGQAFTTVVSFDLRNDDAPPVTATLQSRPGAVFASHGALYLSVVQRRRPRGGDRWYSFYPAVDEVSEIHKFRIGAAAAETRYQGSGVVPGHVLNQFAMDEWYGALRVATTRGRVPDPRVESAVSILAEAEGGNLVRVGAVEKIAPGEDIRAVRFDDDRGYVVTFKKTDPLFVLDLYQPSRPTLLGELKIPGFSTYLHRIDPDHLLSIGFDAEDHGSFAYFDGILLQLFDVSSPTDPRLLHKEKIGTRGSSSEAATNHLAFNYLADRGLLAVPMTVCEGGGDGRNGTELTFSGLYVYDVSVERGFQRRGGVDHGIKGYNCGLWWSHASSLVKRSVFLDDLVYSIAEDRLKVQNLARLGADVAEISLAP